MITDEENIDKILELLKQKPSGFDQFRKWLPTILVAITLIGFVFAPFRRAEKERIELKRDITTIKQILWKELPPSQEYMDNPFTTRSIKIGLYGSEIYCNFANNETKK